MKSAQQYKNRILRNSETMRRFTQNDCDEEYEDERRNTMGNHSAHRFHDQLHDCFQPVNRIREKIEEIEENQQMAVQRRRQKLEERKTKVHNRCSPLSISNNGSAISKIFSTNSRISTVSKKIDHFQNIASITEAENQNLKEQNQYLLEKIKKMKQKEVKFAKILQKAKKYKALYEDTLDELEIAIEQRDAYKRKSEEMKKIALHDVVSLEDKIYPLLMAQEDDGSVNSSSFSKNQTEKTKEQTDGPQFPAQYL